MNVWLGIFCIVTGFCDARDLLYRAPYLLPTLLFIVSAT